MQKIMLNAKLHRAVVTEADLNYEGSCAIDKELLDASGMREFEKIEIYNINNGERFSTYIITADPGSGIVSLNGAAARRAVVGDKLIICTYANVNENECSSHIPTIILVNDKNQISHIKSQNRVL
jgi:aspartate 1-decarboxylase